jgi:hypothetical protein
MMMRSFRSFVDYLTRTLLGSRNLLYSVLHMKPIPGKELEIKLITYLNSKIN